ncbi:MAG: TlpA disulfide reductase family protein [Bacteroides sp.]|jgi:thiol-disulfide isomerase/thioredoxin|nr:TlpA disulfide reductase family protein [Bacteroides sp.]
MRKLLLILSLGFLAACSQPPEDPSVKLSGSIVNPNTEPIEFVFYRDFTNNHREIITLELDEQNQFEVSFDMPEPAIGVLRNGRSSIQLFLKPGDELEILADAGNWLESIEFSGEAGDVNAFFVNYQRGLMPAVGMRFISNVATNKAPEDLLTTLDSIAELKMNFLKTYPGSQEFDPDFRAFYKTEVEFQNNLGLLYFLGMQQSNDTLDVAPELPERFSSFLENPALFDDSRLNSETYVNFLLAYLEHCAQGPAISFMEDASEHEINYHLARERIPGKSGEYVQAISINREFNYGDLEKAKAMYDDFMANALDEDLKLRLTHTWEGIQALMPGNPAPDFTMTDINGQEVSLSDYRGKVVFLKFWASWCGPCMRQVPPAKELKKRLAGQEDIVFMYVSIDTDTTAWRNAVERHEISGVHFNTPGRERGVPALFQVKWIPTFFIIGKDGNIFDNRPPQPSDPEVDETLLKALAQ